MTIVSVLLSPVLHMVATFGQVQAERCLKNINVNKLLGYSITILLSSASIKLVKLLSMLTNNLSFLISGVTKLKARGSMAQLPNEVGGSARYFELYHHIL